MRILLAAILLATGALAGCAADEDPEGGSQTGTVAFAVTDAPTDEFQKVEVTISRVAIHRSASGSDGATSTSTTGTNGTGNGTSTSTATSTNATATSGGNATQDEGPAAGWVTIVSAPRTVDLLALHRNNTAETLGLAQVQAGHYQQVRFYVDKVVGTRTDGTQENMTVPSGVVRTSGSFTVEAGGNTTLTVEIHLDQSIRCNNQGCRFQPHIGRVEATDG